MVDSWKFETRDAHAGFYRAGDSWTGHYASFFFGLERGITFDQMKQEVLCRAAEHHRRALMDIEMEQNKMLEGKS